MAEVAEIHRGAIVIAAHTDIIASVADPWRVKGEKGVLEKRHVPRLRAGGVTVICDHLGGDTRYAYAPATHIHSTPLQRTMRMLDHAYMEAEESQSIMIATTVEDIYRAKREDKIALVICLEGAAALEDEIYCLRNLHRLGLRCLGLTHNWRNSVADGMGECSGGGLTYFGIEVVKECNRLGIVLDVSHLSDRGTEDVLKHSSQPISASHSNARAVQPHGRNLTDEQIKGIAQSGGVIGLHAINFLVTNDPQPTLDHFLRHIVHIAEVGGIDCVGIGPDLMENWDMNSFKLIMEGAPRFASVPLKGLNFVYPQGMSSLAELPNITAGLLKLGFSEKDVTKVLGGNFLRLFQQVWGHDSG